MKVLAIDTSSRCGAVGISDDGEPLAEVMLRSQEVHSARLLPSIDWALSISGLTLDDLDGFGVVTGPGSFTGLRVGLATIKGLAWAKKKPVVALHSLEALCGPLRESPLVLAPMLDARKERVYGALYRWSGGKLVTLRPAEDVSATALVGAAEGELLAFGDGSRRYAAPIVAAAPGRVRLADPAYDLPRGAELAKMAYDLLRSGKADDPIALEPLYLRLSEAELKERERANV